MLGDIQRYFNIMNLLGYSYYSIISNSRMGLVSSYDIRPHGKMYFHINPVEYITLIADEYGNKILHIIFNYKSVSRSFFLSGLIVKNLKRNSYLL